MRQNITDIWNRFREASWLEKCNLLAFGCLLAFVFDCSFSGGGHYVTFGPLSPRMIFAIGALALSVPGWLKNLRKYLTNPILLMFLVFLVYLAICAVRGFLADNRRNVLMSDLKGFMWLFLVPVFMGTVTSRKRFDKVLSAIMAGAVVQALLVFVINHICNFVENGITLVYLPFAALQLGTINHVSVQMFRIFTSSCPYMVIACAIALFRQIREEKIRVRYVAVVVLCLSAILLSFTRSVYGCVFVVLACTVVALLWFYRKEALKITKFIAISVAAILCFVFILEFVYSSNYLNFAVSRTLGMEPKPSYAVSLRQKWDSSDLKQNIETGLKELLTPKKENTEIEATEPSTTDKKEEIKQEQEAINKQDMAQQQQYMDLTLRSDELRQVTMGELKDLIRQSPIFGNGLGAHAPSRVMGLDPATDGMDEYFYLDVLARMGIVGLVLYLLPFGYITVCCFKKCRELRAFHGGVALMCGIIGFWAITWFNPWMNAALGITGYSLASTLPQILNEEK